MSRPLRLARFTTLFATVALLVSALPACRAPRGGGGDGPPTSAATAPAGPRAVVTGLKNPSCVTFSPSGALTVCDSGHGRVLLVEDGRARELVAGYETEHWKVDAETGTKRFALGPLSAVWLQDGRLVVSDAGLKDGQEVLRVHTLDAGGGPQGPEDGAATNAVGPTTEDPADKGEGNLTGFALSPGGGKVYVCGQGADAGTWVLRADLATMQLTPWASADANGIAVNSPMQALVLPSGNVLVLYSGAGGKEDGLVVEWSARTARPVAQWTLPGLIDPMGMALVPDGSGDLAVVDNNWALTEVREGALARVSLPAGGGAAAVTVVSRDLRGPVSCAYGPDGRLYVAELGERFDETLGRVVVTDL